MKKNKIDLRISAYFPWGMIFVGLLLPFAGLAVFIAANPIAGIVLMLGGVVILTTHYRLKVDFETRHYHEYVWLLGLRLGKAERFKKIEYLFIKKSKLSQNMNSLISSRTITKDVFDGYMKFSGNSTIHLLTQENKARLVNRLKKMSDLLQVQLVDYATEESNV